MDFRTIVNSLSNWQRNQWAKAGYPGLHKEEVDKVKPYLSLKKDRVNS